MRGDTSTKSLRGKPQTKESNEACLSVRIREDGPVGGLSKPADDIRTASRHEGQ